MLRIYSRITKAYGGQGRGLAHLRNKTQAIRALPNAGAIGFTTVLDNPFLESSCLRHPAAF